VAAALGMVPPRGEIARNTAGWLLGITLVYAIMFGTGALLFGQRTKLMVFGAIALVSGTALTRMLRTPRLDSHARQDIA
jgi:hypothetical protein